MNRYDESSTSWPDIVAGIIVGTAIGAFAALLYAPKKGEETRAELLERLDALKQRVDATAAEIATVARERLTECCTDLQQAVTAGCEATRERMAEMKPPSGLE